MTIDFLSEFGEWIAAKSRSMAEVYGFEQEDVYQELSLALLEGRSKRLAVLTVLKRNWSPFRRCDMCGRRNPSWSQECQGCGDPITPVVREVDFDLDELEAESKDRDFLLDCREILDDDEFEMLMLTQAGHTQETIAEIDGVTQQAVSLRLQAIYAKIREATE